MRYLLPVTLCCLFLSACSNNSEVIRSDAQQFKPTINPQNWPLYDPPIKRNPVIEQQITDLLSRMTLEEKVGQVIQADIASVTPKDVAQYNLGAVLNGGNSAPKNNNRTDAIHWLTLADQLWQASTDVSDGGVGIPILWGTDAIHGNSNVVGATVFPHNIGLGAANDPEMMFKIGQVTAKEILVTGQDWTFSPTLAVARNDRWGRTYESFSESPQRVASLAGKLISGIQGQLNSSDFLGQSHVLTTAKHFVGDGGTTDGIDQGEVVVSEAELRDVHAAGYIPAIQSGVQTVMASYSSWQGAKMHGSKVMLTDVLVDRLGFDGFVVGDWNGHGQVTDCSNVSCPQAFNAGLDMFMAPDSWKELYNNTLKQVKSGEISERRLNQAVARILRVKMRAGLFDAGLPSNRPFAGQWQLLASKEHRALAREAVRKSLVLLKNNNQLLPLKPSMNVLVAGEGAHNIGQQTGGWTLSWQGTGNARADFPNGQSIYEGIAEVVSQAGGTVELSEQGSFEVKPDVAIVVFGEQPYAEFQGDRPHIDLMHDNGLKVLQKLKSQGIPTVSIFLSGRPMWVHPEMNQSDAFIAAWLPGTEGGGIADLLFTDVRGNLRYDFTGRLSFSWPDLPSDAELNAGELDYAPLFPLGYGLSVNDNTALGPLNEKSDSDSHEYTTRYIYAGDPVFPWSMVLVDPSGLTPVTSNLETSSAGNLLAVAADDKAQEDTIIFTWRGDAAVSIEGNPVDLSKQTRGNMTFQIDYRVISATDPQASLILGCGEGCSVSMDISESLKSVAGQGWQTALVKLKCFASSGANMSSVQTPFSIQSTAGLVMQLREVKVVSDLGQANCSL
ncbi:exo 1,3/1,4-beta-D-glucan glucohydrolase [Aliiglaciecola litoralis]|uniref:Exo 1,3/1,4-beta-D-glucan glucohydrolase n=1 Tax=Aliiglaciecola litoralis TaxID=582857 RepID=A0ABN1LGI4_9ALTE